MTKPAALLRRFYQVTEVADRLGLHKVIDEPGRAAS